MPRSIPSAATISTLPAPPANYDPKYMQNLVGILNRVLKQTNDQVNQAALSASNANDLAQSAQDLASTNSNQLQGLQGTSSVGQETANAGGLSLSTYRGQWYSYETYHQGDWVLYQNFLWESTDTNTNSIPVSTNTDWTSVASAGNFINYKGSWNPAVTYSAGDEVAYAGNAYQALVPNVNQTPSNTSSFWNLLGPADLDSVANGATYGKVNLSQLNGDGTINVAALDLPLSDFVGTWNSTTTYTSNQVVSYQNYTWECLATNTNSAPTTSNPNWSQLWASTLIEFVGAWVSSTAYLAGQEVSYLGNAYQAIQNTTAGIVPTNTSYWLLLGPATLDSIADGTNYSKILAAAISSGQINFAASSGWINKTLDNMPDGTSYAKVLAAAISSGNLNFGSGTGWINKVLDNLADGTAYSKTSSSVVTNGSLLRSAVSTILQLSPSNFWQLSYNNGSAILNLTDHGSAPITLVSSGTIPTNSFTLVSGDGSNPAQIGSASGVGIISSTGQITFGSAWSFQCWVGTATGAAPTSVLPVFAAANVAYPSSPTGSAEFLYINTNGQIVAMSAMGTITSAVQDWSTSHHVAINYNSGVNFSMWVDGNLVNTLTSGSFTYGPLYPVFGGNWNGSAWTFSENLLVQDPAFWNAMIMTAGRAQTLYQAGSAGAQNMDVINDGATWLKVGGVNGSNQTTTGSYLGGSVTTNYTATGSAVSSITNTSAVTATTQSVPSVSTAYSLLISWGCHITFNNSGGAAGVSANINVMIDSSTLATYNYSTNIGPGGEVDVYFSIPLTVFNASAGSSHTVSITVQSPSGSTTTPLSLSGSNLSIVVLKA